MKIIGILLLVITYIGAGYYDWKIAIILTCFYFVIKLEILNLLEELNNYDN